MMKQLFLLAAMCAISTGSIAKDLPASAKPMTEAERIEILSGNKIEGIFYGKNCKKAGDWIVEWNDNGSKIAVVTVTGKKPAKKTLKWEVKDGQFCEQGFRDETMVCGHENTYFKDGNTCFTTLKDSKFITNEFPC
ncbi:hypothetical protein ACP90_09790 [Labrenzia sp. CP4]|jgi:hypothetical protein|uniref:hypothetical protein n=1 Tax=Labrenzia sp. CP4 TaxID=1674922 RepID=UPI0007854F98|nr:hypothetical protein [Labrenzia sp. CP4]AMN52665.1 hypothetical protein ACP90_09790 [Labrenzia sp. CP4]